MMLIGKTPVSLFYHDSNGENSSELVLPWLLLRKLQWVSFTMTLTGKTPVSLFYHDSNGENSSELVLPWL